MKTKPCARCEVTIPVRGALKYCAPCRAEVTREGKRLFEEAKRRAAGVPPIGTPITCASCGGLAIRNNGAAKYCEPCSAKTTKRLQRESGRRHYAKSPPRIRDPEEARARQVRYRERHRERHRLRSAAYNGANRELINAKSRARSGTEKRRAYIREWERRKAATDPAFVLNRRMKQALRASLRGEKRGRRWEQLVGYSIEDLRAHLERQFMPGMGWANMSEWHVDHILPKAIFAYSKPEDPEFRACWALTNLRPLWDVENMSKGAKRLHLI